MTKQVPKILFFIDPSLASSHLVHSTPRFGTFDFHHISIHTLRHPLYPSRSHPHHHPLPIPWYNSIRCKLT